MLRAIRSLPADLTKQVLKFVIQRKAPNSPGMCQPNIWALFKAPALLGWR